MNIQKVLELNNKNRKNYTIQIYIFKFITLHYKIKFITIIDSYNDKIISSLKRLNTVLL